MEKCVGHSLKPLDIVLKIWPSLIKLFAPLVYQVGYAPASTILAILQVRH